MKLTVLLDNNTLIDRYYKGEPGLCFLVEENRHRFLLDTGYSCVFAENALSMGIDLCTLDGIVLSHGHNDHTWGLNHLISLYKTHNPRPKPRLIAHPHVFAPKYADGMEIGINLSRTSLEQYFTVELHHSPLWLTGRLLYLGEIPRIHPFEERVCGLCGGEPDTLPDDTALVYHADDGIVILTGCSHSGICNIIDRAIELTGDDRIVDIVGGFHLLNASDALLDSVCGFFSDKHIGCIHPCHCTDLRAKIALSKAVPVRETGVGLTLEY